MKLEFDKLRAGISSNAYHRKLYGTDRIIDYVWFFVPLIFNHHRWFVISNFQPVIFMTFISVTQ